MKMELEKRISGGSEGGDESDGGGGGEKGNQIALVGSRSIVGNRAFGGKTEAVSLPRPSKTAADSPSTAADSSRRLWATRQFALGIGQNAAILSALFSIMILGSDYDSLPSGSHPDLVGPDMRWETVLWRGFVIYLLTGLRNVGCEVLEERSLGVRYAVQAGTLPSPGWNVHVDAVGMGVSSAVGNIIMLQNGLF